MTPLWAYHWSEVRTRSGISLQNGLSTALVTSAICLMAVAIAILINVATESFSSALSCDTLFARASNGEHIGDQDAWDDYELLCDLGPPARPTLP